MSGYSGYAGYGGYGAAADIPAATVPDMEALSPGAVDRFIVDNRLDDSAARLLRSERPEVQAAVIGRGSLADCRNPSSAVMGRIRDAKMAADTRLDAGPHGFAGGEHSGMAPQL